MDSQRIRHLLDQRDEIDRELVMLVSGAAPSATTSTRRPATCSLCGKDGHNARACPDKTTPAVPNGNDPN